jgi:tetratricopeptide (TPR) repeat protein
LERYESAIGDYDEAIHINPNYAEAYYQRAEANSSLHAFTKAMKDIQTVVPLAEQTDDADLMNRIHDLFDQINSRTVGGSEDE